MVALEPVADSRVRPRIHAAVGHPRRQRVHGVQPGPQRGALVDQGQNFVGQIAQHALELPQQPDVEEAERMPSEVRPIVLRQQALEVLQRGQRPPGQHHLLDGVAPGLVVNLPPRHRDQSVHPQGYERPPQRGTQLSHEAGVVVHHERPLVPEAQVPEARGPHERVVEHGVELLPVRRHLLRGEAREQRRVGVAVVQELDDGQRLVQAHVIAVPQGGHRERATCGAAIDVAPVLDCQTVRAIPQR